MSTTLTPNCDIAIPQFSSNIMCQCLRIHVCTFINLSNSQDGNVDQNTA